VCGVWCVCMWCVCVLCGVCVCVCVVCVCVCVCVGYGLKVRGLNPGGATGFFLLRAGQTGPNQPLIPLISRFFLGVKRAGCGADTHIHLVARLRMSAAASTPPCTFTMWTGNFTF